MSNKQLPAGFLDVFQVAVLSSTHQGAFVEQGGKAIRATSEQGYLCSGVYRDNYPRQPLRAVFSILVDNNMANDEYVLFLDIYDHYSQSVVGKRLITRKDFPTANTMWLFPIDFTPPRPRANLEFRMYYMGHSYVRADKIAIIDPSKVNIGDASQIPGDNGNVEPSQPQLQPTGVNISPWKIARFGSGNGTISSYDITRHKIDTGKSEFWFRGFLTVDAVGSSKGCDDVLFPYIEWKDQFGHARIWAAYFSPDSQGFVGVMIRESLDPDAKFILLEAHRVLYCSQNGGSITEKILTDPHFPQEVRMDRRGHNENQSFELFIVKRNNKEIKESIRLNLSDHLYVGPVIGKYRGKFEMCTKYKDKAGIYTRENSQC
jgi:hypothetical protein